MPQTTRVLVVANRTAATPALLEEVARRARRSDATFHLLVPATPRGLHRVVDPEDARHHQDAIRNLAAAIPKLSMAVGAHVSGSLGDPNPLAAIEDALHLQGFDEIIISTLPRRVSRWIRLDLLSKARALGVPVTHVDPDAVDACVIERPDGILQTWPTTASASSARAPVGLS